MSETHNSFRTLQRGSSNLSVENWTFYAKKDGKLKKMFIGGSRRAEWYLKKRDNEGNPFAKQIGKRKILLLFKPKGYGYDENDVFGLSKRIIRCVVTGKGDDLQRHHIVPYCYRNHFKEEFKSKNHHDVVLIHYKEHQKYEKVATEFKDKLARMYDVPTLKELNIAYSKKNKEITEIEIKCLANIRSIFVNFNKMPHEIIVEKLKKVADYIGMSRKQIFTYNYIQLFKMYKILKEKYDEKLNNFREKTKFEYDHGYQLVNKLKGDQEVEEFIKIWRAHFVQTMKPKYMPKGWNINYTCKKRI